MTALTPAYSQKNIGGVKLPATMKVGNTELVLNGGGIREKWFLDIYVGGLYVKSKSSDANSIIAANEPMAMRIKMVSSLISSEKMEAATRDGFNKSTDGKTNSISSSIESLISVFTNEEIKEGDLYDIKFEGSSGTKVYKNGNLKATIPGLEFKKALFGIWLCDDPVDEDLKEGMLNL